MHPFARSPASRPSSQSMRTLPETLRVLQVPHTPTRQALGMGRPNPSAASRIVLSAQAVASRPEVANTTDALAPSVAAAGTGAGDAWGFATSTRRGRGNRPSNADEGERRSGNGVLLLSRSMGTGTAAASAAASPTGIAGDLTGVALVGAGRDRAPPKLSACKYAIGYSASVRAPLTVSMNGVGPHRKTVRSRKSGTASSISRAEIRPVRPLQFGEPAWVSV